MGSSLRLVFKDMLTLYCIFAMISHVFEETHFPILSRLGFIFDGFLFPHEIWDNALFACVGVNIYRNADGKSTPKHTPFLVK